MPDTTRINKFLAHAHGMSRREADNAVASGRVTINGTRAQMGSRVASSDTVALNGTVLGQKTRYTYLVLHKPVGYVCSRRRQGDTPTIYELLPEQYRTLKPVGRLDKDSSGILLLTDDGDFAHSMTHPKFYKTKVYEVELNKPLEPLHQQMISDFGVTLEDGVSKFLIEKSEGREGADGHDARVKSQESRVEDAATDSEMPHKRVARGGADPKDVSSDETILGADRATGPALSDLRSEAYDGSGQETSRYLVTMHEGRNRQIRRTFGGLGYMVKKLHRTTFGNYSLGDIKTGEHTLVDIH